jgi:hypothetical protein
METILDNRQPHSFYIPVMGTAFTIDTPLKVGKFGISSVISIGDDELCENMREFYAKESGLPFEPIKKTQLDYRSCRIKGYLNLVDVILKRQIETIKGESFSPSTDLTKYFELLDNNSPLRKDYEKMLGLTDLNDKENLQNALRQKVVPGTIDVNIMTKLDKQNYSRKGDLLPDEFSDALSALKGYAESTLRSSIIFSAGFNRRLYAYITKCKDFFPNAEGDLKKKIVIKVSDYRSSLIQGKFLAKKGAWVSEYRIESGLNCGGHAFPSEGKLLGPILDVFKHKKDELFESLFKICNGALQSKELQTFPGVPFTKVTVQGGIGTVNEDQFLRSEFQVDETGWATPFLLVPEATHCDDETRQLLVNAEGKDLYLSGISPLGVPFNTVRGTASESQKMERAANGNPGSPCPKGFLVSNTEFTKVPICTASKLYQRKKLAQLEEMDLNADQKQIHTKQVIDKVCLCEDLAASALIESNINNKRPLKSAICPGPNLANFSKISSLKEMIGHIYGRLSLLNQNITRSNMFIAELKMYVKFLKSDVVKTIAPDKKKLSYFVEFKDNLFEGIEFYKVLLPKMVQETTNYRKYAYQELSEITQDLEYFIESNKPCFQGTKKIS